ncbi:hypothetical protein MY4824_004448 [Beauveria thailandica]
MARPQLMSQAVESELQVAVQVTLQIICAALHVSHVAEEPATSAGAQIRFRALAHAADLAILRQRYGSTWKTRCSSHGGPDFGNEERHAEALK